MAHHILYAFALIVVFPQRIAETFAEEEEDEIARLSSFVMAIGDLIKITLGPKGMDMDMIQVAHGRSAGQVEVTIDGADDYEGGLRRLCEPEKPIEQNLPGGERPRRRHVRG
uniref:T-complex protein 1 subunit beta n=1 Tax=Culex pipiens TaxID=7175 RepID=A0A8D8FPS0_CULPI